jgi:two-component system chemotaxis response regulator CheY
MPNFNLLPPFLTSSNMDKKTILIVDDDNSTRLLLGFLLKQQYQVFTKKDGMEAMLWLNEGNLPDLILLDMSMPRLSGYNFLLNLRKSGFFKDVPVIIVSGSDRLKDIEFFLQNKRNDFLHKPFNPQNLFKKVEKALSPPVID